MWKCWLIQFIKAVVSHSATTVSSNSLLCSFYIVGKWWNTGSLQLYPGIFSQPLLIHLNVPLLPPGWRKAQDLCSSGTWLKLGQKKDFFFQLFQNLRAGKMAQPGKGFATKPNILSFIPETHRENWLSQVVFWQQACHWVHTPSPNPNPTY